MSLTFPLDENGDVLRRLQRGGDDLSLPRDVSFSVVFATEEGAIAFAQRLVSGDARAEVERADVVPGLPWEVTVSRHMVPGHGAIGSFEDSLASQALPLGGRNDGWGCFAQMNLASVIASLESIDASLTIVARRPWRADSEARLVSTADYGRIPGIAQASGLEYFLEVSVALEEVLGTMASRLSLDQRIAAVIYFAENDAYPAWLNTLAESWRG